MTATLSRWTGTVLATLALLLCTASVHAQRQPLTPQEQALVNRAIAQGVTFLRATEGQNGCWVDAKKSHPVGYAALPALTLLECDVPANDPGILAAAAFVRQNAPKLDTTYEVSLAILFLDRLNDPRDKALIQQLAVRLIVGQSQTGGWGYKVPLLTATQQLEFLTVLRRAYPKTPQVAITDTPMKTPQLGVTDTPAKQPQVGITDTPMKTPSAGITTTDTKSPTPAMIGKAPGDKPETSPGYTTYNEKETPSRVGVPRRGMCIKMLDLSPSAAPSDSAPAPAKAPVKSDDWVIPPAKPVAIPVLYQGLSVFQDPARLQLVDPPGRDHQSLLATTDNSNTQFAILALWAAQRHDVPMDRSLMMIAHRFVTSQNQDGSWDYHYKFGGTNASRPAMSAVGLIGLAIGHGLNNRDVGGKAQELQDPRILMGFVALDKHIGKPTGQMQGRPQVNLYVLWSIERVAVLYNLATVGDKDWYRWGAEVLVANQQQNGNWDKGGYPGASPISDTCFALLFLKRANLVQDLTVRLPFDSQNLTASITESVKNDEKQDKPATTMTAAVESPSKPAADLPGNYAITTRKDPAPPNSALTTTTSEPTSNDETLVSNDGSRGSKKWLVLGILAAVFLVALLACLVVYLIYRYVDKRQQIDANKGDMKDKQGGKMAGRKPLRS